MPRVKINSNTAEGIFEKLVFCIQGPFVVISPLGVDTYSLQRYGKEKSIPLKYHVNDLYLVHKSILPCKHTNMPDLSYLNSDFAPLHQPLSAKYDIAGYKIRLFYNVIVSKPPIFSKGTLTTTHGSFTPLPLSNSFYVDENGTAVSKSSPPPTTTATCTLLLE